MLTGRSMCAIAMGALLLGAPQEAAAKDWWAILEEFSGPGDFKGRQYVATVCFTSAWNWKSLRGSPLLTQDDAGRAITPRHLHCAFADKGVYELQAAGIYPDIRVDLNEFGYARRVHDGVDLGVGAGWFAFETDRVRRRPTLGPRVVLRPLTLLVSEARRRPWFNVLNLYWKAPYVGELTGEHFGVDPSLFHSDGEFVPSYGIVLDFGALLRW